MGIAITMGMAIPDYFETHPVETGVRDVDQMFNILLQIRMFVGGVIAFILDNTCGGATRDERGFQHNDILPVEKVTDTEEADGYAFPQKVNE